MLPLSHYGFKHLDVDVTDTCNLACSHCYHGSCGVKTTDLQPAVQASVITAAQASPVRVNFMGGEPLLAMPVIERIVTTTPLQQWGITSNVTLLDVTKATFIRRHHGGIHCSVDGNAAAHDFVRKFKAGGGSFATVAAKVPLALAVSPRDTARMTVRPETVAELYDSVLAIKRLGFAGVAPVPVFEADWTDAAQDEYRRQLWRLAEWQLTQPQFYIKTFGDFIRGLLRPYPRRQACGAGHSLIAVATDGNLTPCHRFSSVTETEWSLGNLVTGTFDFAKLTAWRQRTIGLPAACERCPNVLGCAGACPNVAVQHGGDPAGLVPNFCWSVAVAAAVGRWLWCRLCRIDNIYLRRTKKCSTCGR